MRIAMIGSGYVGLVSGACFADFGNEVICVDLDETKIEKLRQGVIPIYEPGLDQLVADNVAAKRLSFTTDLADAVASSEVVFIAVGTPSRRGDGHADLSYVYSAAASIAKAVNGFTVVVTKSTVPVGTGDEVERIIRETNPEAEVAVVSNPEFLREGAAIEDFKRPDRIVVGAEGERAQAVMSRVYRPLYLNQSPLVFTNRRTAETIKYAANAFLAMKITFINEIADLCEEVGANVQEVARGIGLDNRIGRKFLNAGPGYGGSCFPKDTLALMKTARDYKAPIEIIEATVRVNSARKQKMAQKIIDALDGNVKGKTIAILGLTFKPNTDDMRDAPALDIVPTLQAEGAKIRAFDPEGMHEARQLLRDVQFATGPYDCVQNADAVVIITEWDQFRALDLGRMKDALKSPTVVDLRNIYRPEEMRAKGFKYVSVGRP
jgi:UDPglucose 6-dehydrogenase